jgi:signal transduction histidine kinase
MNSREIQRLRLKFISISMLSIFLAMTFIGLTVNAFAYAISRLSVNRVLNRVLSSAEELDEQDMEYDFSITDIFAPEYGRNACYVLSFDADGTQLSIQSNVSNSWEAQLVERYAADLLESRRKDGEYHGYYYRKAVKESGETLIAFLEGSVIISTQFRILTLTGILGFLGMLITFFLVSHFSGKAIEPEIRNSQRQKQFITNASHELKTPLAVIRANNEMVELLQGESEWTRSTEKQVEHLNGLIQNLVMITRAQEKEDKAALANVDASRLVCESIEAFESVASQAGKKLERKVEDGVQIKADESKIRQLATILIDNAIKYCDENGTITVALTYLRGGKGLELAVSNNYAAGEGVDYHRFFDRFYREDASHNIDQGSYGIGLSIAESICEQYRGSIDADWKDGVIRFRCILK